MTTSNAFEDLVVSNPDRWALFLDIDGTLIDVAPEPADVYIPCDLAATLERLARGLGGALALNTGRQLAVVDIMLAPTRFPAAGVHGVELRLDANLAPQVLAPHVPEALFAAVIEMTYGIEGVLVENKSVGLAVHFRNAPEQGAVLEHKLAAILAHWPAYELKGGRKVLECLPRGLSKATAITRFLAHKPFAKRVPLVIGDDRGDEPAIEIARALGGLGFTVAGEYFPAAGADFASATEVRNSLARLSSALVL